MSYQYLCYWLFWKAALARVRLLPLHVLVPMSGGFRSPPSWLTSRLLPVPMSLAWPPPDRGPRVQPGRRCPAQVRQTSLLARLHPRERKPPSQPPAHASRRTPNNTAKAPGCDSPPACPGDNMGPGHICCHLGLARAHLLSRVRRQQALAAPQSVHVGCIEQNPRSVLSVSRIARTGSRADKR